MRIAKRISLLVPSMASKVPMLVVALVVAATMLTAAVVWANAWSPTGNMSTVRQGHTATLLPNGKVLAAGGYDGVNFNSYIGSAELYDPSAGTWSATGSMLVPRLYHTATLLTNGKVLAAAGSPRAHDFPPFGSSTDRAELYDPSTGTWSYTANTMSRRRFDHAATRLADGRVLVSGGYNGNLTPAGPGGSAKGLSWYNWPVCVILTG